MGRWHEDRQLTLPGYNQHRVDRVTWLKCYFYILFPECALAQSHIQKIKGKTAKASERSQFPVKRARLTEAGVNGVNTQTVCKYTVPSRQSPGVQPSKHNKPTQCWLDVFTGS